MCVDSRIAIRRLHLHHRGARDRRLKDAGLVLGSQELRRVVVVVSYVDHDTRQVPLGRSALVAHHDD